MAYFRIAGYDPETDIGFIVDSNGKYDEIWQLSSYLVKKKMKVLAVAEEGQFTDGNIPRAKPSDKIILRVCEFGRPTIDGHLVTVRNKHYEVHK